jgi:NADH:ubiquinone oxidoreductase subunit 4 (subunit M)
VIRFEHADYRNAANPDEWLDGFSIETSPSAEALIYRGGLIVIAGFSLWAGIFPLHSWLPMLTDETHHGSLPFS